MEEKSDRKRNKTNTSEVLWFTGRNQYSCELLRCFYSENIFRSNHA